MPQESWGAPLSATSVGDDLRVVTGIGTGFGAQQSGRDGDVRSAANGSWVCACDNGQGWEPCLDPVRLADLLPWGVGLVLDGT